MSPCHFRQRKRLATTGCSVTWLARLHGVQKVAGSNPVTPTVFRNKPFGDNVEGLCHCGDWSCVAQSICGSSVAQRCLARGSGREAKEIESMMVWLQQALIAIAISISATVAGAFYDAPRARIGALQSGPDQCGCGPNPKVVQRLVIDKPGIYENYLVDGQWNDGTLVKI